MPPIRRVNRSSLKLSIELVPEPCFYSNLRNQIRSPEWDNIRRLVYARYNHQCGICEAKSKKLNCHEIWQYDDRAHIQKLEGFIALCPLCHHVKHIGYARLLAEEGKLNLKQVIDHFCRVNDCSYQMFKAHEEQELKRCTERNRHRWRTDLGEYACLVNPHPQPAEKGRVKESPVVVKQPEKNQQPAELEPPSLPDHKMMIRGQEEGVNQRRDESAFPIVVALELSLKIEAYLMKLAEWAKKKMTQAERTVYVAHLSHVSNRLKWAFVPTKEQIELIHAECDRQLLAYGYRPANAPRREEAAPLRSPF